MAEQVTLTRIDDELHVDRFAEQLLAKLEAASVAEVGGARGRRRPLVVVAAVAVAAAVAVTIAALGALHRGSGASPVGSAPPPASAVMVLLSAATASDRSAPLGPGQYLRVRMLRWTRDADGGLHLVTFTSWMAADGSARFLIYAGGGSAFESSDQRCTAWRCILRVAGAPPEALGPARYGPGRGFTAAQLQRLPTDAGRLLAEIRARARTGIGLSRDPWELGFPMLVAPLPPDVRAALYRGLAQLPGVRRLGMERINGRAGVALVRRVRISGANVQRVIVVDPHTGNLLAARATVDGRLTDRRTYSTRVVESADRAP
ncbi:MAG: CU044_5270 family protein [Gaiellales bacterium]